MPIGTSDGQVFDSEWDHAAKDYVNPEGRPRITVTPRDPEDYLDPTGPFTNGPQGYDDSPTRQQRARDGSVYNNLKQQEGQMVDDLAKPQEPEDKITAQDITHYPQATLDLSTVPKELLSKPMDEPFKDQNEKEGAWKLMMHHVLHEPEIAARDFKKGVGLWAKQTVDSISNAFTVWGDAASGKVDPYSDEARKSAFEMAALVIGGPAPIAAKVVDGTLGSIAGISAKTADTKAFNLANTLEIRGATPEHIWEQTGFFKGIDNKWRFEIPNSDLAKFKMPKSAEEHASDVLKDAGYALDTVGGSYGKKPEYTIRKWKTDIKVNEGNLPVDWQLVMENLRKGGMEGPITNFFKYPDLFEAYPSLKNYTLQIDNKMSDFGLHNAVMEKIKLNLDKIKGSKFTPEEVLIHELQHAIQTKEDFLKGRGSPSSQVDTLAKTLINKVDQASNPLEAAILATRMKELVQQARDKHGKDLGNELYRRDPAEQEANTALYRSRWTPGERYQESPKASQDRFIQSGVYPEPFITPNEALTSK